MRGKIRIKTVHKITNVDDEQNVDDQKQRGKSRNVSGVKTQKRKSNRFQEKKSEQEKKFQNETDTRTERKQIVRQTDRKKEQQTRKKRKIFRSGISKPPNQITAKQKTGRKIQIPPDFFVVPTCILLSFEMSEIPNRLEWR
ncbi:hypothetical protein LEP1GSC062_1032 [Leptospira alexanderi serovar Manhao 3 str. L 60]|uniref:Uncharacterized protein n=1 Tax=Leptospira alexanderi serovar Manhao 3 str. L 60 TaxID=1049759 RepID=V6I0L8_9LEPT|nr:hypothetical protein LEP1GSC062_1032 [Leptospira alexanderi serovar Manhao 3 str. L 60]